MEFFLFAKFNLFRIFFVLKIPRKENPYKEVFLYVIKLFKLVVRNYEHRFACV